ncbi:TetR/AcrR family transcriptional regulator [Amycolatopsis rubida]|uniref:TetR/AcrR family transcriptional regulator n=1 Tax=Amycolatopsis rubida TaxID=112413 RepID=A0A1I5DP74_9PSEU|nr:MULTISPECIES: TetR/AcrR family transcriptional regulator [Amycolatopsis]MYW92535.1 TetR family transcriptional regulator [Amycolatopsis rubida]NEC57521.1 TetR/AcrR family transcriptional regulator [Amycolatopsis rubida]OAP20083.1 Bacterial regulatory protein, tetR family [Amycolatopsis sp. M39]SFO01023.1 transcriptional regulator, TetR family [Amycolatopsis rubida]
MAAQYHHRNLRAELVRVAFDLIAENGITGFSVAEAARRAKVSAAAPYRHFPDRAALLAAVGTVAARRLRELADEAAAAETDDGAALAAVAAAHTKFLIDTRIGLHVFFAAELTGAQYAELHEARRELIDASLLRCLAIAPDPAIALELMEQLHTQAYGYGDFYLNGVHQWLGYPTEQVVAKSRRAARIVIEAYRAETPAISPAEW